MSLIEQLSFDKSMITDSRLCQHYILKTACKESSPKLKVQNLIKENELLKSLASEYEMRAELLKTSLQIVQNDKANLLQQLDLLKNDCQQLRGRLLARQREGRQLKQKNQLLSQQLQQRNGLERQWIQQKQLLVRNYEWFEQRCRLLQKQVAEQKGTDVGQQLNQLSQSCFREIETLNQELAEKENTILKQVDEIRALDSSNRAYAEQVATLRNSIKSMQSDLRNSQETLILELRRRQAGRQSEMSRQQQKLEHQQLLLKELRKQISSRDIKYIELKEKASYYELKHREKLVRRTKWEVSPVQVQQTVKGEETEQLRVARLQLQMQVAKNQSREDQLKILRSELSYKRREVQELSRKISQFEEQHGHVVKLLRARGSPQQ